MTVDEKVIGGIQIPDGDFGHRIKFQPSRVHLFGVAHVSFLLVAKGHPDPVVPADVAFESGADKVGLALVVPEPLERVAVGTLDALLWAVGQRGTVELKAVEGSGRDGKKGAVTDVMRLGQVGHGTAVLDLQARVAMSICKCKVVALTLKMCVRS